MFLSKAAHLQISEEVALRNIIVFLQHVKRSKCAIYKKVIEEHQPISVPCFESGVSLGWGKDVVSHQGKKHDCLIKVKMLPEMEPYLKGVFDRSIF